MLLLRAITAVVILRGTEAALSSQPQHEGQNQDRHRATNQNVYSRLSMAEIYQEMDDLAADYPDFVTVTSTQAEFKLPSPCKSFETQHIGCTNRYIVIEDPIIYSKDKAKKALKYRPDVFLSGALHGDERVGPVAMIEVAKLLVLAASCESGAQSNECTAFYTKYTERQAAWLARLVSTRRIVIFPAANSKGYYSNNRNELYVNSPSGGYNYIDPNRDFSFDNHRSLCMRSITARSVNELFIKYLFQMSMTYHSGIENITFEWGALSIPYRKVSPDDKGQRIMAEKMSYYAGELYPTSYQDQFYEHGDMNTILYGVNGGFEDWVYAGSWKTDMTVQCNPTTYGGYDASKTVYDDATLNTFNILVEISDSKNPPSNQYGTDTNLLNAPFYYDNNVNNGYATKHIRTALMAIDTVEPYVEITGFRSKVFTSELKPLKALNPRWCKKAKKIKQRRGSTATVSWSVGGAFNVDETFLISAKWSDFPWKFNCLNQIGAADINNILNDDTGIYTITDSQSGNTMWTDPMSGSNPTFQASHTVPNTVKRGDMLAVFAVAKVDQSWVEQPNNAWPENTDVQSHIVKIRTDPNYRKRKGQDREVQGRLYWISVPVTIKVR